MTEVTLASWQNLGCDLGAEHWSDTVFLELVARYSERHRHYHTLQHLRECFAHVDAVPKLVQHPEEIAIALWFHDAIYDVHRHDNEAQSAAWAQRALTDAGVGHEACDRIRSLIMATCHNARPDSPDAQILVDVDLAILGESVTRFDAYEQQVRAEYAHVPEQNFRDGRAQILSSFLGQPQLYLTPHFHALLERPARDNLHRSIATLQARATS
jgi:predicted metal-dependent HD superfamily phosphohydrolase